MTSLTILFNLSFPNMSSLVSVFNLNHEGIFRHKNLPKICHSSQLNPLYILKETYKNPVVFGKGVFFPSAFVISFFFFFFDHLQQLFVFVVVGCCWFCYWYWLG